MAALGMRDPYETETKGHRHMKLLSTIVLLSALPIAAAFADQGTDQTPDWTQQVSADGGGGGGTWNISMGDPTVIIGPLGVANNYEIANKGPGCVQISVCNPGSPPSTGPKILKGGTGTAGALAGGTIKAQTDAQGGAHGTYVPED